MDFASSNPQIHLQNSESFTIMWNNLPFDILSHIFSFLLPYSLARAKIVSKPWRACIEACQVSGGGSNHHREQPWFTAFLARDHGVVEKSWCYVYNPSCDGWYSLSLDFLNGPVRPIATINGLVLARPNGPTNLQLCLVNPFTRQYRQLPMLNVNRKSPAIGIVILNPTTNSFRVYVVGGMSTGPNGGATYEPTLEMYDSEYNTWQVMGPIPVELAVRLTVWTPHESVYINGLIYWITSARVFNIMGFHIMSNKWTVLNVPMADKLEFATLARRNEKLTLVGGTSNKGACVWEFDEGENWNLVEKVPIHVEKLFLDQKGGWKGTKCVANDRVIYLYKELKLGMVIWKEDIDKGIWEWIWVDGCNFIKGKEVDNLPIRGMLLHPNLSILI